MREINKLVLMALVAGGATLIASCSTTRIPAKTADLSYSESGPCTGDSATRPYLGLPEADGAIFDEPHRARRYSEKVLDEFGSVVQRFQAPKTADGSVWVFERVVIPSIEDAPSVRQGWIRDGERTGLWMSFWKNGKLAGMGTYEDGKLVGTYLSWFESGELGAAECYLHGVPHGPYLDWYDNGKVEEIGRAVYGEQQGHVRVWDENGELTMDTIIEPED